MKTYLFIALILMTQKIHTQQISGIVLDAESKIPIENVVVTYGMQTIITTSTGKFSFQKNNSIQILKLTKLGYQDHELSLNQNFKDFTVYLKQTSINLDDVLIFSKRDYLADSLRMRKEFAAVFAYKAPTIKDIVVKKGLRRAPFGSNLVSNSTSSIISFDVLKAVGLLTKNKSSISTLKKVQLNEEETKYVDHRFDIEKIAGITKLEGDSLRNFIFKYRPSASDIRKMSDYQILMYAKKSFSEFIKPNEDLP
ncbi:hypothetical protein [Pedobacter aquatilis]|uniref:hypothetical protein n=1 Tax=Pedobacter aquatilis TaxID=351343 RepID=UPI0029313AE2|nr:hypothetical protein [Pedobacter aquatilis]